MASKSNPPTAPTTRPAAPRTTTPTATADRAAPNRPTPNDNDIRTRAYYLWEEAGRPEGDGTQFWLEAEKELRKPR